MSVAVAETYLGERASGNGIPGEKKDPLKFVEKPGSDLAATIEMVLNPDHSDAQELSDLLGRRLAGEAFEEYLIVRAETEVGEQLAPADLQVIRYHVGSQLDRMSVSGPQDFEIQAAREKLQMNASGWGALQAIARSRFRQRVANDPDFGQQIGQAFEQAIDLGNIHPWFTDQMLAAVGRRISENLHSESPAVYRGLAADYVEAVNFAVKQHHVNPADVISGNARARVLGKNLLIGDWLRVGSSGKSINEVGGQLENELRRLVDYRAYQGKEAVSLTDRDYRQLLVLQTLQGLSLPKKVDLLTRNPQLAVGQIIRQLPEAMQASFVSWQEAQIVARVVWEKSRQVDQREQAGGTRIPAWATTAEIGQVDPIVATSLSGIAVSLLLAACGGAVPVVPATAGSGAPASPGGVLLPAPGLTLEPGPSPAATQTLDGASYSSIVPGFAAFSGDGQLVTLTELPTGLNGAGYLPVVDTRGGRSDLVAQIFDMGTGRVCAGNLPDLIGSRTIDPNTGVVSLVESTFLRQAGLETGGVLLYGQADQVNYKVLPVVPLVAGMPENVTCVFAVGDESAAPLVALFINRDNGEIIRQLPLVYGDDENVVLEWGKNGVVLKIKVDDQEILASNSATPPIVTEPSPFDREIPGLPANVSPEFGIGVAQADRELITEAVAVGMQEMGFQEGRTITVVVDNDIEAYVDKLMEVPQHPSGTRDQLIARIKAGQLAQAVRDHLFIYVGDLGTNYDWPSYAKRWPGDGSLEKRKLVIHELNHVRQWLLAGKDGVINNINPPGGSTHGPVFVYEGLSEALAYMTAADSQELQTVINSFAEAVDNKPKNFQLLLAQGDQVKPRAYAQMFFAGLYIYDHYGKAAVDEYFRQIGRVDGVNNWQVAWESAFGETFDQSSVGYDAWVVQKGWNHLGETQGRASKINLAIR